MILNRISTGNRVMGGFLIAALLMLGCVCYGAWRVVEQTNEATAALSEAQSLSGSLARAKAHVLAMEGDLKDALLAHRKEEVDVAQARMGKHQHALEKELAQLDGYSADIAKEVRGHVAAFKTNSNGIVQSILDGRRLDAEELARGDIARQSKALHNKLGGLSQTIDGEVESALGGLDITKQLSDLTPILGALLLIVLGGLVVLRLLASGAAPKSLDVVSGHLEALADGKLDMEDFEVSGSGPMDRLKASSNRVRGRIGGLVGAVESHAEALSAASYALVTTAGRQQEGASSQAAVAKKTRVSLEALLESASEVAEVSQRVFNNAESTQHNAQVVANAVEALSTHAGHLSEWVTEMKEIGNRSDLLALNAALEGAKAGTTGRRFALVAARMERLSEQIIANVKVIEGVASQVSAAAETSSTATEEALTLSKDNTYAARRISLAVQQQREGTQAVVQTMSEIATKSDESVDVSHQVVAASERVGQLAEELNRSLMTLES